MELADTLPGASSGLTTNSRIVAGQITRNWGWNIRQKRNALILFPPKRFQTT